MLAFGFLSFLSVPEFSFLMCFFGPFLFFVCRVADRSYVLRAAGTKKIFLKIDTTFGIEELFFSCPFKTDWIQLSNFELRIRWQKTLNLVLTFCLD